MFCGPSKQNVELEIGCIDIKNKDITLEICQILSSFNILHCHQFEVSVRQDIRGILLINLNQLYSSASWACVALCSWGQSQRLPQSKKTFVSLLWSCMALRWELEYQLRLHPGCIHVSYILQICNNVNKALQLCLFFLIARKNINLWVVQNFPS